MPLTKLCLVSDIPNNSAKEFSIEKLNIAVFHIDSNFFGLDKKCTHLGGNLAKGKIEKFTVTCPLHGAVYNLKTGEIIKQPGTIAGKIKKAKNTKTYKLVAKGNELYIDI